LIVHQITFLVKKLSKRGFLPFEQEAARLNGSVSPLLSIFHRVLLLYVIAGALFSI